MDSTPLNNDLLTGAGAIAEFTGLTERQVYYLASKKNAGLPVFRLGAVICARKSELLKKLSASAA